MISLAFIMLGFNHEVLVNRINLLFFKIYNTIIFLVIATSSY